MKLTSHIAKTIDLPQGKSDVVFWDDDIPGFGVRVRASGSRVYLLQYDHAGRSRRFTIGAVSEMDVGRARKKAMDLRADIRLGGDPAGKKRAAREEATRAAGETFGSLLVPYLDRQRKSVSPRWLIEVTRHLNARAKPLHGRPVAEIDLREVAALLDKVAIEAGPVEANHLRGAIRAFFQWLGAKGILTSNVASFASKAPVNGKRERVLDDQEVVEVWNAADGGDGAGAGAKQFASIVKLLLLLGLRRDEISALRWSEVDLGAKTITLPGARTKSGREHVVPLGPQALAILRAQPRRQQADGSPRDLIFGLAEGVGFRNHDGALNLLRERIEESRRAADISEEMAHWTLHDLRRTVATGMIKRLDIAPHVANACLHHTVAGVAGVYIKEGASFEQRRAALARWDAHVERLVAGARGKKVVPFPRRRRA